LLGSGSDPGSRTPAQAAGDDGEARATAYLAAQGLEILTRNYRTRLGEVDLVAREGELLVFIEVRSRAASRFGGAIESVTPHKQRRIAAAASLYLGRFATPPRCRFDVVALEGPEVRWLRGAFECR
jgi:putative endonuclease